MTTPLRVLIIEDSEDDTALLVRELRRGGYDVTFERVDSPGTLDEAVGKTEWDVVTLLPLRGSPGIHRFKRPGY